MGLAGPIRIGRLSLPRDEAASILAQYTNADANRRAAKPFAYPAYDRLDTGSEPDRLNDGDLLAPQLLNVRVKVDAFYAMQGIRSTLESGLADARLEVPLAEHDNQTIEETVGRLYATLDNARPRGVRATTLSKVVHRKRPESLILHDRWVRACYLGDGPRLVPRDRQRSWARYMIAMTKAVRDDLFRESDTFTALADGLADGVALTHVRILDILAWSAKPAAPA